MSISRTAVNAHLWDIQHCIMRKYGVDQSERDIAPLVWYIETGRASVEFLRAFMAAKPFMIARRIHQVGTYDEVIQRLKDYLG